MTPFSAINLYLDSLYGIGKVQITRDTYEGVRYEVMNDRLVPAIKLLRQAVASCTIVSDDVRVERSFSDFAKFLSRVNARFETKPHLGLREAKSVIDWMMDNRDLL